MKLRVKIKDLSMTLNLTMENHEATVQGLKEKIGAEVHGRIGLRLVCCALSLNGRDPLSESVQESSLSELGVVGGDILHMLDAEFDPPLTQPVAPPKPPPASLHVEPSPMPAGGSEEASAAAKRDPETAESAEPLLVRHARPGRLPRVLTWLAEQAPPDSPEHLLALALHALMLEAGMQPVEPAAAGVGPSVAPAVPAPAAESAPTSEVESASGETTPASDRHTAGYFPGGPAAPRNWHLPAGWRRPGLFQITYGLHFNMALTAVLTIVPMGNATVVHAVPTGGAEIFSVTLRPRDFMATTESADTADRFQNLRQLSNAFKNGVTVPLLVHLQRSVGLLSPHEWRALPLELQLLILRRLSARDLLRVGRTSREMRARANDPLLWRDLLFRDFVVESKRYAALEPVTDWKALYIPLYVMREIARRRHVPLPAVPVPAPLPAVPNVGGWFEPAPMAPPMAGIIGGEYDRLPGLGFQPPLAVPRGRLDGLLPGRRQRRRRLGNDPAAAAFFGGGRLL